MVPGQGHTQPEQEGRLPFLVPALITRREAETVAEDMGPQARRVGLEVKGDLVLMALREEMVQVHAPLLRHSVMRGWAQMDRLHQLALILLNHSVVVVVVEAVGKP